MNVKEKMLASVSHYKKVFGSEQGKKVLYDLARNHFLLRPSYVKGDTYETAFNEGQRNVVLRILSILKMDELQLIEMIKQREGEQNE